MYSLTTIKPNLSQKLNHTASLSLCWWKCLMICNIPLVHHQCESLKTEIIGFTFNVMHMNIDSMIRLCSRFSTDYLLDVKWENESYLENFSFWPLPFCHMMLKLLYIKLKFSLFMSCLRLGNEIIYSGYLSLSRDIFFYVWSISNSILKEKEKMRFIFPVYGLNERAPMWSCSKFMNKIKNLKNLCGQHV